MKFAFADIVEISTNIYC